MSYSPFLITLAGLVTLTGVKFPEANGKALATGDNDLYLCPTGKKAWVGITGVFNGSGVGNIVAFPEAKIGGTYFRLAAATTVTNNTGNSLGIASGYLLNAGESFSVNSITNNGLNVFPSIIEFDSTVPIFITRLNTFAAGDNTIYTAPANKTVFPINVGLTNQPYAGGSLIYTNDSGVNRTISSFTVKSGDVTGTNNKTINAATIATGAQNALSRIGMLAPGDFLVINTDANTATQTAYVITVEI